MKKLGNIIINILQLLLLLGAFALNYFTKKKMGMARHMVYLNQKIENNYPVEIIKYSLLSIIILMTIFILILYMKNKNDKTNDIYMISITLIASILFIVFTISQSKQSIKSYYFIVLLIGVFYILQILKSILKIVKGKQNENKFSG